MRSWRYLEDDAVGAARGLAVDEALLGAHGRDGTGEWDGSLRLYTYRPHCALVGRYQSLEDEVNLDFCAAQGFEVGRRPTGGGAIIMGPGQLGVAIAAASQPEETPRLALRRLATGVAAGLEKLGIEARFRSKNDLEVGGRKIAGLGLYLDPAGAELFHASVLVDLDVRLMLEVLRIPGAKVSDKAVARVEDRVTTVSRELARPIGVAEVRSVFASAIAGVSGRDLEVGELSDEEEQRADHLVATRYGSPDWVAQRSPRRNARGNTLLKTAEGLLRIYVGVQGPALKSVLITGDFNFPPRALPRLEAALKWCRAEPERIGRIVREVLADEDAELALDPAVLTAAVWEAVVRARELEKSSHPLRREGSCYFPDPAERGSAVEEESR